MSQSQTFNLTPGQTLVLIDPTSNSGSAQAQLQNGTGYTLNVLNGQGPQSIAPNTAATYSTQGGAAITLVVGAVGSPGVGLTVLWLLPGQQSDMQDGAIPVTYLPPVYNASSSSGTAGVPIGSTVQIVAAPPAGYANVLSLLSLRQNCDHLEFFILDTVTTTTVITDLWIPVGPAEHPEYSLIEPFGLDFTTMEAVQASFSSTGSSAGSQIQVTLTYRQLLLAA